MKKAPARSAGPFWLRDHVTDVCAKDGGEPFPGCVEQRRPGSVGAGDASGLLGNPECGVAILSAGRDLFVGLLRLLKPFAVRCVSGLDGMNRL